MPIMFVLWLIICYDIIFDIDGSCVVIDIHNMYINPRNYEDILKQIIHSKLKLIDLSTEILRCIKHRLRIDAEN